MARYENISKAIWDDPDFDALSINAALVYLWSFTNPRCGMAGIYPVLRREIAAGRLSGDDLEDALSELEAARFLFYEEGVLWVRTRMKHLVTKGEKMERGIVSELEALSDHPLLERLRGEYEGTWIAAAIARAIGTPSMGSQDSPSRAKSEDPSEPHRRVPMPMPMPSTSERRPRKSSSPDVNQPPSGFPEPLVPIAEQCVEILGRVAAAKEAKPVTLLAVCRAIESYPRRRYVAVAGNLEHWCLHGNGAKRPAKDVVARWRNFLDGSDEVAPSSPNGQADRSAYAKRVKRNPELEGANP